MLEDLISLSCRTCMKQNATISLYQSVKIDESSELQLAQLLLECTTIQVAENDGLPQIICQECKNLLQMWFSFRQQAFKSDHDFKKIIESNLLKEEIKEESEDNYEPLTEQTENLEVELKSEKIKVFSCSKCHKTYSEEGEYLKHLESHLNFSCSYCNEHFKKESSLLKHISRTHSEIEYDIKTDSNEALSSIIYSTITENEDGAKEIRFKCQFCEKSYPKILALKKHMKKSHKELTEQYQKLNYFNLFCIYCNKQFKKESSLLKHISHVHNELKETGTNSVPITDYSTITIENESGVEEIRYQCQFCETLYPKLTHLKLHMRKHKADKPMFVCDTCGKGFMNKQCLKRHVHLHLDNEPYHCRVCSKPYKRKDQLKVHMLTHKTDKPNVCSYCNKAFVQLCSLKDHIRVHTKETPYLCSECGKGFANSSNLRQHMMRHTGIKQHQCKLCPKKFCTKGQMTSHMSTHSGAHPFKCGTCGARFTKSASLKKHASVHSGLRPHACDTCLMRFSCKDHLKRHQRIHTGEKPYKCKYCARAYTQSNDLVKHLRTHVGQNVYSCSVCGMGFRLQTELKQHYPIHYCTESDVTALLNTSSQPTAPVDTDMQTDKRTDTQMNMQTDKRTDIQADKFLITINSMDGTNVLAINIEPDTLKVS